MRLDRGDPLFAVQQHLWQQMGLPPSGQLSQAHPLSSWLVAARISRLTAVSCAGGGCSDDCSQASADPPTKCARPRRQS
jgi:hypothetical protein